MLSSVEARFKHEAAYDSTCVGRRFIGSVPRVDTLVLSHLPLQERKGIGVFLNSEFATSE